MLPVHKRHIALEGLDGSGKSNVIEYLKDFHSYSHSGQFIFDRSPVDPSGRIRKLLSNEFNMSHDELQNELLNAFMLDHLEHSRQIDEILTKNPDSFVISDRYIASTCAYQSVYFGFEYISNLIIKSEIALPGLTIFLAASPKICIERINHRGEKKEIYEKENTLQKVFENYAEFFDDYRFCQLITDIQNTDSMMTYDTDSSSETVMIAADESKSDVAYNVKNVIDTYIGLI